MQSVVKVAVQQRARIGINDTRLGVLYRATAPAQAVGCIVIGTCRGGVKLPPVILHQANLSLHNSLQVTSEYWEFEELPVGSSVTITQE